MSCTCPTCGVENREGAVRCISCGAELSIVPSVLPVPGEIPSEPPPWPPPPVTLPIPFWTDTRLRVLELCLVCSVAFGGSLLVSIYSLFAGQPPVRGIEGALRWEYMMVHQLSTLGVLYYVLLRRSRSFAELGLIWNRRELLSAPLLWLAAYGVYVTWRDTFASLVAPLVGSESHLARSLFADGISYATMLAQFVNPFFEELIVRAYVMTEVKQLTNSVPLAIAASVLLQTSYHLYQGLVSAVSLMVIFLIFSLYYAKTNRIVAPILAHLLMDVWATWHYLASAPR